MPAWASISATLADWRPPKVTAVWTLPPVEYAGIPKCLDIGTRLQQVLLNRQKCHITPPRRRGKGEPYKFMLSSWYKRWFTNRSYFSFNYVPLAMLPNCKPTIVTSPSFPGSQTQATKRKFPFVNCSVINQHLGKRTWRGVEKLRYTAFENVSVKYICVTNFWRAGICGPTVFLFFFF